MGLFDSLFSGGTTNASTVGKPGRASQDVINPSLDVIKSLLWQQMGIQHPGNPYWDNLASAAQANALNPLQKAGLQKQIDYNQGPNQFSGAPAAVSGLISSGGLTGPVGDLAHSLTTGGIGNPAMQGVSDIASGSQVGRNPYLDASFNQAATNFKNQAVPALTGQFAAGGRLGSTAYANALGSQLNSGLGQLATNIYGGAYNTERQNQLSALGLQGQLGQEDTQNQLAGAGLYDTGIQRLLQGITIGPSADQLGQLQGKNLYDLGTTQQAAPYQTPLAALQAAEGVPGGTSQTQQGSTMNAVTGTIGALGSLATAAGLFATSDERLKDDGKVKVGNLPIYRWRYKGTKQAHVGPMAQDVAKVMPDKVRRGPGGFLAIPASMVS